jgi:glycogen synthase
VRILVISNLFPPHHAGTYDFRCQSVVERLRARGHEARVLTSNHGLRTEERGLAVERRLRLSGDFGHPAVTQPLDLKDLEAHNNRIVVETSREFRPDVIYVWSLHALSKSILFTLERSGLPVAFDIADRWLADELAEDPWLSFWNREQLPFKDKAIRASLELSGQRDRFDEVAPTRPAREVKRLPFLFGAATPPEPNSITVFHFEHASFPSQTLKDATIGAGFAVAHAEVIHPLINMAAFSRVARRAGGDGRRLLVFTKMCQGSGVMTALRAFADLYAADPQMSLTIAGHGESDYVAKLRSFAVQQGLPVVFEMIHDSVTELPALFAKHDVLLHTAESDSLFTLSPVEAMAAGLPVITTSYGTVSEVFRHGENAVIYAAGDADDLASRVRELQTQPDLCNQLAEQAQKEILAAFDESTTLDRVEALLQRAAGQSG